MLAIGLFGFGRTGSIVANEIIKDKECELRWVVRKSSIHEGEYASHLLNQDHEEGKIFSLNNIDFESFYKENQVDVIIDFSASCAVNEYYWAGQRGVRIVSAISSYDEKDFEQLRILSCNTAVLYAPNITFGINFLIGVSKLLQQLAPQSNIEIIEEHYQDKKGISGTALRIAESLNLDKDKYVHSVRVSDIVGKHEVIFGLPHQTIRITHESTTRSAFGQGAIHGAKFIMTKKNGLYSMEQALSFSVADKE
mgnify:CR=1 FL=1